MALKAEDIFERNWDTLYFTAMTGKTSSVHLIQMCSVEINFDKVSVFFDASWFQALSIYLSILTRMPSHFRVAVLTKERTTHMPVLFSGYFNH